MYVCGEPHLSCRACVPPITDGMDQATGFREMPRIFRAYCCALGLAALVTAPLLVTTGHVPQDGRHALGALAVALLLAASVRGLVWPSSIADENEVQQTLTEAFSLPLMAIAGPAAALVCTQLAALVGAAQDRRSGRAWHFLVTTELRHVVEVGLAYAAFAALNGPGLRWLWAVFAGAAVSILSSFALAAFGFKLQRQKGDAPLRWGTIARELALQLAILPTLAVITLTLFDRAALLPLLVASPILALRIAAAADNRRRAAEKRLGVDPLTQLSNHERFWRRLETELETPGARVAVVLLDVDDFKGLNDRHGHLTGDACLQAVAGGADELRPAGRRARPLRRRGVPRSSFPGPTRPTPGPSPSGCAAPSRRATSWASRSPSASPRRRSTATPDASWSPPPTPRCTRRSGPARTGSSSPTPLILLAIRTVAGRFAHRLQSRGARAAEGRQGVRPRRGDRDPGRRDRVRPRRGGDRQARRRSAAVPPPRPHPARTPTGGCC